jgi:hypothetical protein
MLKISIWPRLSATVTKGTVYAGMQPGHYCDCPDIASNDKSITDSDINDATLARDSTEAEHRRLVGPCRAVRRMELTSRVTGDQPIRLGLARYMSAEKGDRMRTCRIGQWSVSAYSYSLVVLSQ